MAAEPQPKAHSNAFDVLSAANKELWLMKPHHSMQIPHTRSLWLGAEPAQAMNNCQLRIVDSSGQFTDMFLLAERDSRRIKLIYAPSIHERPHVKASVTLKSVRVGSEIPTIFNAFRILMSVAYPTAWKVARAAAEPAPASVYEKLKSGEEPKTSFTIPEGKVLLSVRYLSGWRDSPVKPLLVHVMLFPIASTKNLYYTSLLLTPIDAETFKLEHSVVKDTVVCTSREYHVKGEAFIAGTGLTNGISVKVQPLPEQLEHVRTTTDLLRGLVKIAVARLREATDKRKRGFA